MAFLLRIPQAAFNVGGIFEGKDKHRTSVSVQIKEGAPFDVTVNALFFEDWEFHPQNARIYGDMLTLNNRGMIEFIDVATGLPLNATGLTNIFKTYFQEL